MDGVLCDKYKIDATGSQYAASTLATGTLIWINASNRRPVKAQATTPMGVVVAHYISYEHIASVPDSFFVLPRGCTIVTLSEAQQKAMVKTADSAEEKLKQQPK